MKPASLAHTHAPFRRAMRPTTLLATALALCGAASVQALPVIPGSAGFGMDTKAGRGGTVYKVTNLNASGSGSLKACIDATVPRTCVFEVSGAIRITSDLTIRNGQIRIAGQTAPSPGIMIRGAAILITASDVLIQHIRVRTGDDTNGPNPDNRDSLKITGTSTKPVRNVVIDHCSFSWSIDEIASTWGPHDNITFTNNIFAEPLNESLHPQYDGSGLMPHGYGVLFGPADNSSITFVGNLMAHIVERNPLSRAAELVMVNNLVYNRGTMDVDSAEPGWPRLEDFRRRQHVPARAQLQPRHEADLRAHQRRAFAVARQSRVCLRQPRAGQRQHLLGAGDAHRR